jgi:DNA modification methylase
VVRVKLHRLGRATLIEGEATAALRVFKADRFDSVVTDPPYELGFMNKGWDASGIAFSVDFWREVLRVLKPGAHLLAFGGTRTYHRMTCAIEDAGFEIRDSLHWFYGTGFPKSLNVGEGRGTALKPGHEPIVLARKPLIGTVAGNVATHGTGALNIDACRIPGTVKGNGLSSEGTAPVGFTGPEHVGGFRSVPTADREGRWPANVLLDESAAGELDAQTADLKTGGKIGADTAAAAAADTTRLTFGSDTRPRGEWQPYDDSGGASRFFYVAKPSRAERDLGCDHLPVKSGGEATDREDGSAGTQNPRAGAGRNGGVRNYHPTVKPVDLMRYLVRLVTPAGGCVLDPFTGSGTTGIAALLEGREFIGLEREAEYAAIAAARIGSVRQIHDSSQGAA